MTAVSEVLARAKDEGYDGHQNIVQNGANTLMKGKANSVSWRGSLICGRAVASASCRACHSGAGNSLSCSREGDSSTVPCASTR